MGVCIKIVLTYLFNRTMLILWRFNKHLNHLPLSWTHSGTSKRQMWFVALLHFFFPTSCVSLGGVTSLLLSENEKLRHVWESLIKQKRLNEHNGNPECMEKSPCWFHNEKRWYGGLKHSCFSIQVLSFINYLAWNRGPDPLLFNHSTHSTSISQ